MAFKVVRHANVGAFLKPLLGYGWTLIVSGTVRNVIHHSV